MSRRANFPSTNDIQNQIESSFENAGRDVAPISIDSSSQAASEVEKLVKDFNNPRAEWDTTVKLIERSMGMINGGLFNYLDDQTIKSSLSKISIPLLNASNNLRSALVKQSCLLIAQIAHELGNKFELFMPIGDDMVNTLSCQTSHGTQIIAESCRFAIIHIARSCAIKKILRSIIELSKVKSSANRQISAECLCFICGGEINSDQNNPWKETKLVEQNDNIVSEALQRLMEDASQNIRKTARLAAQIFIENYPQFEEQLLSGTDERSINYINRKCSEKKSGISTKRSKSPYTSNLPVSKSKRKRSSVPTGNTDIDDSQDSTTKRSRPNQNNFNDYQRETKNNTSKSKDKRTNIISDETNNKSNSFGNNSSKRRSKSSLPARPPTFEPRPNLEYKEGHEDEFLKTIEEYINTNQQYDLSQSLNTIIPGIFSCCDSNDESIKKRSIAIIQNLINTFPNSFTLHIPRILNLVLEPNETSENNDQASSENTKSDDEDILAFCRDLHSIYNPNILLKSTENIKPSPILLKFVANLCDDVETDLHEDQTCKHVYNIATPFINEDQDSTRRVMYAIWCQDKDFFQKISSEGPQEQDNEEEEQQIKGLDPQIEQMIQDFKENPGHPRFNPRGVSLWCDETRHFITTEQFMQKVENDNEDVKTLFDEISHALTLTNEKNLVISLMGDALKATNNSHFDIFLFDVVRYYRDRKAKDILKLLKYMITNIDNEDIIKSLLNDVDPALETKDTKERNSMIRNIIEIITEIVRTGNKEKVEQQFDPIISLLLRFINHDDTEIRRAVIMAFVELSFAMPEETHQVINDQLNKVQQKLVGFYRDQRE